MKYRVKGDYQMIVANFMSAWKQFKAHYMVILLCIILSFGMLTVVCLASNNTISDIDATLLSLSTVEDTEPSSAGDAERIEALISLIAMYSEQLEEYDRSGGSFVVGCMGIAGVILGLVVAFFSTENEKHKLVRPNYGVAFLFSLIPGIMTLCLYVFSMQCRRVEFFRGYLTYLEEKLSKLIEIPMVFNSKVVSTFFGEFMTMRMGFVVMAVVVVFVFLVPAERCLHTATAEGCSKCIFTKSGFVFWLFFAVLSVYGIACLIFVYDLCTNDVIATQVYQYCLEFHG